MNQINKKDLLSINCNGELISLSTPKVMGILNITPDSFYDGGRYKDTKSILIQVEAFLDQGATFIDIGAYSSRPGAAFVSEEEELKRITPVIDLILKSFPDCKISIDSFRSKVIQKCVEAGAVISNDISSGKLDPLMFETIAKLKVPYIMMHMKGTPQNMQKHTEYEDLVNDFENSVNEILDYCGLPFEESCLNFYESKRSVRTPSSEQVRQPIYKGGLDYWKNYESYLTTLKKGLRY